MKRIGVVGAGLMGSGIAEVSAKAGFATVVREVSDDLLARGRKRLEGSLAKAVEKGKLGTSDRDAALSRLSFTTRLEDLGACDLVIEAIVEDLAAKRTVFAALDAACGAGTIFCSNTSSLGITEMAGATKRPDRFAGLHFFNPVPVMKLVEVVRALTTSDATFEEVLAFARALGKEPVAARDGSGFIVNRLLVPYLLDAIRALEEGVGSRDDIDAGMRLGCAHPMGPLELSDYVGLDTLLSISEIMFGEFRERRFAAPPLLRRTVLAGRLGKKSGQGFYRWSERGEKLG